MMAAACPEEGSRQKVHFGRIITSPIPLSVWSFPDSLKVSLTKNCVPNSRSTVLLRPAERIVVPSARALYWFGAEVSGSIPSEIASTLRRRPPGSIVCVVSVTWERRSGASTRARRRAAKNDGRMNLRGSGIRGRLASPGGPVTTKRARERRCRFSRR